MSPKPPGKSKTKSALAIQPDFRRRQKKILFSRQRDAELVLLQVAFAEHYVVIEQGLFAETVVGGFRTVEHFAVGPAAVGKP